MLLNFKEYGEGRPIVILHGLLGSSRNWQGIARKLAEEHRVITPDLRNHGQSPHAESMSYQEMGADVIALIRRLKLDDVILIGHSMGGKVAMTVALTHPQQLTALIVVDIAPVAYRHNFAKLISAMNALPLQSIRNRSDAEAYLTQTIDEPGLIQFILQNLVRIGNQFEWRVNLEKISASMPSIHQFPDSLKDISSRLPTLFLGGAESDYLRSVYNPEIFRYFPAAEIKMIKDAGHWLHAEKPGDFLDQVKPFIHYV